MTALGVLCCFALFVCLTLLASFFLPSHLSFKNMYKYMYLYIHVHDIVHVDERCRRKEEESKVIQSKAAKHTNACVYSTCVLCRCLCRIHFHHSLVSPSLLFSSPCSPREKGAVIWRRNWKGAVIWRRNWRL